MKHATTGLVQSLQQPGTGKTAKSSLNTNEKVAAKLMLNKGASTDKKVKSRAASNNKQQQVLA